LHPRYLREKGQKMAGQMPCQQNAVSSVHPTSSNRARVRWVE
jgi:hypothetical protein